MGILSYLVRRQILKTFQATDPEKKKRNYWLLFLHQGKFDLNFWQSLVDRSIKEHNKSWRDYLQSNHQQKKFQAQSYLTGIVNFWQLQAKASLLPPLQLRWYERILLWLISPSEPLEDQLLMENILFSSLEEKISFKAVMKSGITAPQEEYLPHEFRCGFSYPEKYTARELLQAARIKQLSSHPAEQKTSALRYEFKTSAIKKTAYTPIVHIHYIEKKALIEQTIDREIKTEIEKTISLDLNQEAEQAFSLEQQQELSMNVRLENELLLEDWSDFSEKYSFDEVYAQLVQANRGGLFKTLSWMQALKQHYPTKKIVISHTLSEVLLKGIHSIEASFDPKILPLGFFTNNTNDSVILCFNPLLRKRQLALKNYGLRDDPAQRQDSIDPIMEHFVGEEDVRPYLLIGNENKQKAVKDLYEWLNTHYVETKYGMKYTPKAGLLVYRSLQTMIGIAASDEQKKKQLFAFLELLIELKNKQFTYAYQDKEIQLNLLEIFAESYLVDLSFACDFYESETYPHKINTLKRLLEAKDNELAWFYELSIRNKMTATSRHFLKNTQALFYFLQHFQRFGPLPSRKKGRKPSAFGLNHLKALLNCLDSIEDPQNRRLQFQLIDEMPKNIEKAQEQLRIGYRLIHKDMCLEEGDGILSFRQFQKQFPLLQEPFIIQEEDLLNLDYPKQGKAVNARYYWAFFLRYAALNLSLDTFNGLIKQWESIFRAASIEANSEELDSLLRTHWNTLKAQHCPHYQIKTEKAVPKPKSLVVTLPEIPPYAPDEIEALFKKLTLEEKIADNLKKTIVQIDAVAGPLPYPLKDNSLVNRIALLRMLYYQFSNPKKWLRLEQLVSVLLLLKDNSLLQVDTGEGKTTIIQMACLVNALAGKKSDVITHNHELAQESHDSLKKLATFLNLAIAKKSSTTEEILKADIYFVDIASAVTDEALAKLSGEEQSSEKKRLPGHRRADCAYVDEVDNISIDTHAKTSMQIALQTEDTVVSKELEVFLMKVNHLVRSSKQISLQSIKEKLIQDPYYLAHPEELKRWKLAAEQAADFIKDDDYFLDPSSDQDDYSHIRIMHKETTGRKDLVAVWGNGIHACIATWEKQQNPKMNIKIPAASKVIAVGNLANFLRKYPRRFGLTATIGNLKMQALIKEILQLKACFRIPRAKRQLPLELRQRTQWPKYSGTETYSRRYDFAPIFSQTRAEHVLQLLDVCSQIESKKQSGIFFFNTRNECELFFRDAKKYGISENCIQILDDTVYEEDSTRPPEATVIRQANKPGMITLTTAAGARGTDFEQVTFSILTVPGLKHVSEQKKGRVGRNGQLGISYELYCVEDLDASCQGADPLDFKFRLKQTEERIQKQDINKLASMGFFGQGAELVVSNGSQIISAQL